MLKYAVWQWDANKAALEEAIRNDASLNHCDYCYLVQLVVRHILNGEYRMNGFENWRWSEEIALIDDGNYQGTLLFILNRDTYQPSAYEYLITEVSYGSCSGCDTLLAIQGFNDAPPDDGQVKDFMQLCKDITTSMVHPFPELYDEDKWAHARVRRNSK